MDTASRTLRAPAPPRGDAAGLVIQRDTRWNIKQVSGFARLGRLVGKDVAGEPEEALPGLGFCKVEYGVAA